MKNKKLLILNGSHSEIPLIKAAKRLGFYVITTGNAPELIGHNFADEYHNTDFSDKDSVLSLSKKLKIDAICSCANDFGAITASYVAEKMGLAGHDNYNTTLKIHHKDEFKAFASKFKIKTPSAVSFDNLNKALTTPIKYNLPVIIKPTDMTGGKGISVVHTENDFKKAVNCAFLKSKKKSIVVEKFFKGSQHSFSTFIIDKKVIFNFSDNEYSYINPYLVSTSSAPAENIKTHSNALIKTAEFIANALNLVDGILHFQYLANDEELQIIEITRRCSGDLYPLPVTMACDIDWASWIVRSETGMDCSDFPSTVQNIFCGRHCIMSSKNGIINDIIFKDSIKENIYEQLLWWKPGDLVTNYMTQKFGVVLLKYSTNNEMNEKTKNINDLIHLSLID